MTTSPHACVHTERLPHKGDLAASETALPLPAARVERHPFRAIASQAAAGFGWTAAALLVSFLTKMLLTRKMPAAEFGIVLAAQSFMALVLVVAELGMPDAVLRYVARERAPRRIVHAGMKVVAASTLLAAMLLLAGLSMWFRDVMAAEAFWATAVFILALPLLALGDVVGAAYRGIGRLGTKLFALDVGRPGFVAVAVLVSPLALTRHASYVAGLYVSGALVTLLAIWGLFWRDRRWHAGGTVTRHQLLSFGIPMAGAGILAGPFVNSVIPIMLSAWTGGTAVAFYGIALSLQGLVVLPIGIIELAVIPTWTRMAAQPTTEHLADSYRQYTNMCFAAATSVALLIIANDRMILTLLFGPAYEAASWALRCAIIATLLGALTGPNEAMHLALGFPGSAFKARLHAAVAGAVAGLVLIPAHGLPGAVVAFAVASVVVNAHYAVSLYRKTSIHPITGRHMMTAAMATAGVLAATMLPDISAAGARIIACALALLVLAVNADVRSGIGNFFVRAEG